MKKSQMFIADLEICRVRSAGDARHPFMTNFKQYLGFLIVGVQSAEGAAIPNVLATGEAT